MRPFQVEGPSGDLVVVDDLLKIQCRIDGDEMDAALEAYIASAIALLDGYQGRLGRCILRQKWALPFDASKIWIDLPFPDCREFGLEYLDSENEWQSLDGAEFEKGFDRVAVSDVPTHDGPVYLTFYAGWEDASAVPASLTQAIRLLVAHWTAPEAEEKSGSQKLPFGVECLISPLVHLA